MIQLTSGAFVFEVSSGYSSKYRIYCNTISSNEFRFGRFLGLYTCKIFLKENLIVLRGSILVFKQHAGVTASKPH